VAGKPQPSGAIRRGEFPGGREFNGNRILLTVPKGKEAATQQVPPSPIKASASGYSGAPAVAVAKAGVSK